MTMTDIADQKNRSRHLGVRRRNSAPRAQQTEDTHKRLFHAAAKVVGSQGYAAASVSLITQEAGVAQGTFYNYFNSRQDLLDQLLPSLGQELHEFVRERIRGSRSAVQREERQIRAFFDFLMLRPEFYRILHEAEMYAPEGYRQHFRNVERVFVVGLEGDLRRGEIKGLEPKELEVASYIMMAARDYLMIRYGRYDNKVKEIPEWVIQAYMKVVTNGVLRAGEQGD